MKNKFGQLESRSKCWKNTKKHQKSEKWWLADTYALRDVLAPNI